MNFNLIFFTWNIKFIFYSLQLIIGIAFLVTYLRTIYVKLTMRRKPEWRDVESLRTIYGHFPKLQKPLSLERWTDDRWFAWQRINGLNSTLIKVVNNPEQQNIPARVMNELRNPEEAIIFVVDLGIVEEAFATGNVRYISCAIITNFRAKHIPIATAVTGCVRVINFISNFQPMAYFYLENGQPLMPLAIRLLGNGRIYLPGEGNIWTLAKMWFNLADAQYHQCITHLGFTHLLMEGVCASVHRNLSESHPLFKLVAPHFLYTLQIDKAAQDFLLRPGGTIDEVMFVGVEGTYQLIAAKMNTWRMDEDGTLPNDFNIRGFNNQDVLPEYFFREDALKLYKEIYNYVRDYVNLYYGAQNDDNQALANDTELFSFRQHLVMDRGVNGGCGILGVPEFNTLEGVITAFTSIIYTSSVAHAAANFAQYEEYGFPPNYPSILRGQPPEQDEDPAIAEALPSPEETFGILLLTRVLSTHTTNILGDFEHQFIQDREAVKVLERFRERLKNISQEIKQRNIRRRRRRVLEYHWLDPVEIPNSIAV